MARWLVAIVVLAAGGAVAIRSWSSAQPAPSALLQSARQQLATGVFDEAERLALAAVAEDPSLTFAWVIAGESALHRRHYDSALEHFAEVAPDARIDLVPRARYGEAIAAYESRRLGRCERCLRQALGIQPDWFEARLRLVRLLGVTGRRWEQLPQIMTLLKNRNFQAELLLDLLGKDLPSGSAELLEEATIAEPSNPHAWLGLACLATEIRQMARAGELLERARSLSPNHPEIEVRWGLWLLDNRPEEFAAWHESLPPEVAKHPELWIARARWAERQAEPDAAVRCYWEALLEDPDLAEANRGVGRLLIRLGRPVDAEPYLIRADRLDQLTEIAERMRNEPPESPDVVRLIEILEQCGRYWEASSWASLAMEYHPRMRWAASTIHRTTAHLDAGFPRSSPELQPALSIPLGGYRLPDIGGIAEPVARAADSRIPETIHFEDATNLLSINFNYSTAPLLSPQQDRIIDTTGGGVAVFDYDRNGQPDVYFTQGGNYPFEPGKDLPTDRLYRSESRERVSDVTYDTKLVDVDFGQGAAAGDVDNDGFPDLYVGNLGWNRLWINLGDGTFVAASEFDAQAQWTTSVAIADLDGDTVPDLFDTGYCLGANLQSTSYRVFKGREVARHSLFRAAPDRVWCGRGDGTFRSIDSPVLDRPDGYGLAVAIGDFDGDHGLNLLVADEGAHTNFLKVHADGPDARPRISDSERQSLPAARGIACADVGGDGRLDLLLATQGPLPWTLLNGRRSEDPAASMPTPLDPEPTSDFSGYGAQFLDADLDGRPDLVITTGDISRPIPLGLSGSIAPRFYWNAGDDQFLGAAGSVGEYFAAQRVGRGLARLDWDIDGRPDFAASHLGSPVALVLNRSEPVGRPLTLLLVSTRSARDAIGTTVTVTAGPARRSQQLTAGDGFQASNERALMFGLPKSAPLAVVRVVWPGGHSEQFRLSPSVRRAVLIEGRTDPVILTRDQ